MGTNANTTNTQSKLPQFSGLSELEQRVITLRASNHKWEQITEAVNAEFATTYSWRTLQEWVAPNGKLEQAYLEYLDYTAKRSLKRAEMRAQQATDDAIKVLVDIMKSDIEKAADRVAAAKAVANKFLPDKQMLINAEQEADLPAELLSEADDIFESEHASNNQPTNRAAKDPHTAPAGNAHPTTGSKAAQKAGSKGSKAIS